MTMPLTKEEVIRVMQGPRDQWSGWFEALPATEYVNLARVLRELKMGAGIGCMPASAVKAMTDVVDDRLLASIVQDSRRGVSPPSSLAGPVEPRPAPVKGSGWDKPRLLEPPSGVQLCDQIADHFAKIDREQMIADAIDRVRKVKS
jgi:hypothetical protein